MAGEEKALDLSVVLLFIVVKRHYGLLLQQFHFIQFSRIFSHFSKEPHSSFSDV